MSTTRLDLLVRSGTTLGAPVQYETDGALAAVTDLVAGDRVMFDGAPWTVFANTVASATRNRVRLGEGLWWEPDLLVAPDSLMPRAVAHPWQEVTVSWRDPYGRRSPIPSTVDPDGVTLVLVPHTDEARQWSTDLGHIIDGTIPAPLPPDETLPQTWRMAYDYDLNATFSDLPGFYQVLQGTLIIQPSVAAPLIGVALA